MKARRSLE
uniref:Uncharacterized protein n=1 Tax=Arundo donax TaxID=35708 RepID=A0A0A9A9X3_ARUDO